MLRSIPVIADLPTERPGLGFREYVEALSGAIVGGDPPQFTIGLYGAWGSGKSSLLEGVKAQLAGDEDARTIPVLFDAWRYEREDHVVVPLLHAVLRAVKDAGEPRLVEHLKRALASLVFSLNFKPFGVGVAAKDVKDGWEQGAVTDLDAAFARPLDELRGLGRALDGKRIAVLVDDLDRCSPEKVVSLLETINVVMDIRGFIFVLAIDYDVLTAAVQRRYPYLSGDAFVEKIVQLPFRVPPLVVDSPAFLSELVPNWDSTSRELPAMDPDCLVSISVLGLRSNPRQIKRLINSLLLVQSIIERRRLSLDPSLVAALIGVQLRWPAMHHAFQEAVFAEAQEPFAVFSSAGDDALERYAARFFAGSDVQLDQLRQLLQMTAIVAADDDGAVDPAARRERDLRWLIQELENRGFDESGKDPNGGRVFSNPERNNHRFVFEADAIRFEKRGPQGWSKWDVYSPAQVELAIEVLERPHMHFATDARRGGSTSP